MRYSNRVSKALIVLGVSAALVAACTSSNDNHQSFASPEEAVAALIAASEKDDRASLIRIFGPGAEDVIDSGDAVQDEADRTSFVTAYRAKNSLVADGDDKRTLIIGVREWPVPIPIVRNNGRWQFDGDAGADEIVYRRIGANELGAIAVARGFVTAQRQYAAQGRDGDPAGIFALKLVSDPGLHNGLYWRAAEGETPSPTQEFVADAAAEGYRRGTLQPYHGYLYRMLYRQGADARGGAREYFDNGLLTQGFALVAWPADYGVSGIMTFIVNQDGVVFQKDLGDETEAKVAALSAFNPDGTWSEVPEKGTRVSALEDD